jgi:hypothetical protein
MKYDPFNLRHFEAIGRALIPLPPAVLVALVRPHPLLPSFLFDKAAEPVSAHPLFPPARQAARPEVHVHVHLDGEATRAALGGAAAAKAE